MLGLKGVDIELLLGPGPPLVCGDDAVAKRRTRPIPVPLPGVLTHGAERVLGVFLRLVFIEKRHDPPHHYAHRIIAQILRDRDEPNAILGEMPDVEFELELVAEEPRKGMDQNDVEHRWPRGGRIHHALKFRTSIVSC